MSLNSNNSDLEDDSEYSLHEKLFQGEANLVGYTTTNGTKITSIMIPLVSNKGIKGDIIMYKGIKIIDGKYIDVVLKTTEDINDVIEGVNNMNKIVEFGIPLYFYELDYVENESNRNDKVPLLAMEILKPVEKNDVFSMLTQLIPIVFKWRSFMAHCDIKPDNIMKSADSKKFYFIDYDSICQEPLLYGYRRQTFTPFFATQSSKVMPVMITFKEDLLELLASATAIYYKEQLKSSAIYHETYTVDNISRYDRYHFSRIFSIPYLTALNIDPINITIEDRKLKKSNSANKDVEINEKLRLNEYLILFELQQIYDIINDKNTDKAINIIDKIADLIYNKKESNENIAKLFM